MSVSPARVPGNWQFCGIPVASPLGIPAGPLLNSRWLLYYASLGFDVLTYKTVRSSAHACYPLPNLQPVACQQLRGDECDLPATDAMRGSWAVSFGMPSKEPAVWRADVELARKELPPEKILCVSVVGTVQDGWTVGQLGDDYAQCAKWAAESGADCVEANFSCPNVSTCDGQLFQNPADASIVCARVREKIGSLPFIVKVGHISHEEAAHALLESVAPYVNAIAITNSIATTVVGHDGARFFDSQKRGICGGATRLASIRQTRMLHHLIQQYELSLQLIGVGGVSCADHVLQYLDAGAHAVHLATAPMTHPEVGLAIRKELASLSD